MKYLIMMSMFTVAAYAGDEKLEQRKRHSVPPISVPPIIVSTTPIPIVHTGSRRSSLENSPRYIELDNLAAFSPSTSPTRTLLLSAFCRDDTNSPRFASDH